MLHFFRPKSVSNYYLAIVTNILVRKEMFTLFQLKIYCFKLLRLPIHVSNWFLQLIIFFANSKLCFSQNPQKPQNGDGNRNLNSVDITVQWNCYIHSFRYYQVRKCVATLPDNGVYLIVIVNSLEVRVVRPAERVCKFVARAARWLCGDHSVLQTGMAHLRLYIHGCVKGASTKLGFVTIKSW